MTTDEIKQLATEANEVIAKVVQAIRNLTAGNPLILFDKDDANTQMDSIYELPIGYHVDKYGSYCQGAVWKVEGDEVILFFTGEDWGQLWYQNLDDLPFSSLIEILNLIAEKK